MTLYLTTKDDLPHVIEGPEEPDGTSPDPALRWKKYAEEFKIAVENSIKCHNREKAIEDTFKATGRNPLDLYCEVPAEGSIYPVYFLPEGLTVKFEGSGDNRVAILILNSEETQESIFNDMIHRYNYLINKDKKSPYQASQEIRKLFTVTRK